MRLNHPSPALVISLIALFVALGGTSYAAITALPANSVGTKQLKTGAVTGAKLSPAMIRYFLHAGSTLPSGRTEVGDWGAGGVQGADDGGAEARPVFSFALPLAHGLDANHTIYVSGASAPYCPGAGHAARGYLCLYQADGNNASPPDTDDTVNPEVPGQGGTGTHGFAMLLQANSVGNWDISGTYAVTAP
jgi:hypothetical protein